MSNDLFKSIKAFSEVNARDQAVEHKLDYRAFESVLEPLKDLCSGITLQDTFLIPDSNNNNHWNMLQKFNQITNILNGNFQNTSQGTSDICKLCLELLRSQIFVAKVASLSRYILGDTYNNFHEQVKAEVAKTRDEYQSTVSQFKTILPLGAMEVGAKHFIKERNMHRRFSRYWLMATISIGAALVVSALVVIIANFCWSSDQSISHDKITITDMPFVKTTTTEKVDRPFAIAQGAVNKILWFGMLFTFFVFSSRTYSAHIHNSIVSQHRLNGLKTYRAIAAATADEKNRDSILAKAAECIFAQQPTGFGKQDADNSTNILNTVIPKKEA